MINEAARWRNLRHGGGVSGLVSRRHGQSDQLSHGHLQQAAAGRLGLRGEQSLGKGRKKKQIMLLCPSFVCEGQPIRRLTGS